MGRIGRKQQDALSGAGEPQCARGGAGRFSHAALSSKEEKPDPVRWVPAAVRLGRRGRGPRGSRLRCAGGGKAPERIEAARLLVRRRNEAQGKPGKCVLRLAHDATFLRAASFAQRAAPSRRRGQAIDDDLCDSRADAPQRRDSVLGLAKRKLFR